MSKNFDIYKSCFVKKQIKAECFITEIDPSDYFKKEIKSNIRIENNNRKRKNNELDEINQLNEINNIIPTNKHNTNIKLNAAPSKLFFKNKRFKRFWNGR